MKKKRKFHIVDPVGERAANRGFAYLGIAIALLIAALLIILP